MMNFWIALSGILATIVLYIVTSKLYKRFPNPFLNPAILSTCIIVVFLMIFHIPYNTYMIGGQWVDKLLGPSVVALAFPLYKQKGILLKYLFPLAIGVLVGIVVGATTGILFAESLGFSKEIIFSLIPKTITIPVAIQIVSQLGGASSLTVVFVMIAGFTGALLGPYILKIFRINSFIGQGISFGSSSHAIGTSKAIEYSQETGAISSAAMTLSAVLGSLVIPFIVWVIYH